MSNYDLNFNIALAPKELMCVRAERHACVCFPGHMLASHTQARAWSVLSCAS